jgi:hypothetical protein
MLREHKEPDWKIAYTQYKNVERKHAEADRYLPDVNEVKPPAGRPLPVV